jgi:hypothetical protein
MYSLDKPIIEEEYVGWGGVGWGGVGRGGWGGVNAYTVRSSV